MDNFLDKLNKIVPVKWQWILSHEGFRRYFKNTGWMFFGQMFSLLVSFFIGAWLARYLGPENYGVFNYAIAFVGLFGVIAPLGIDAILSRELITYPEKSNELMGTAFVLKIVGGLIAFFATCVAAYFLETNYLIKLIIVIFSFNFLFAPLNVIATFFNSNVKAKNNVLVVTITTVIISILKISLILSGLGILWLSVIFLLEAFFQSFGLFVVYKNNGYLIKKWVFNKNLALSFLKTSLFLMLASAATVIYLKIDQIMIGKMMSSTNVGLYAAAVKLSDIWYFIPGIICGSLFPAIINAKKSNQALYKNRLKNLYLLMFLLSVVIALPISLLSKQLMFWMFGGEYISAASVLSIYVWAGVGVFLGTAVNQYLMSENMLRTIFILNILTMTTNVALNLYLIPLIGLNGAAIATLISYLLIPIVIFCFGGFFKKHIK